MRSSQSAALAAAADECCANENINSVTLKYGVLGQPSRSRGAPEAPEPLTLGAQYLPRYNTWKNVARDTRQALLCSSPKTNIRVICFVLTGSFSLEEVNWSEIVCPKRATLIVG